MDSQNPPLPPRRTFAQLFPHAVAPDPLSPPSNSLPTSGEGELSPIAETPVPPRSLRGRSRRDRSPLPAEDSLTIHVDTNPRPSSIPREDREKGKEILDEIGRRFAENRRKGKSTAYEEYQNDIAHNSQFLIAGGLLTVKELSELLMKIEEFRKSTTDTRETPGSLLGKWLQGGDIQLT